MSLPEAAQMRGAPTQEWELNVYVFGVAPLVEARGKSGADESLLEEASRYSHSETCSFPSLLLLFVPGGGGEKEADGSERVVSIDLEEGAEEYEGRVLPTKDVERVLEEEEGSVLGSWMNGSFVNLYRCLGMPTEGFEGEILLLLRRMKERKNLKGDLVGKRRKIQKVSRSEMELKKLECSTNYSGAGRNAGETKKEPWRRKMFRLGGHQLERSLWFPVESNKGGRLTYSMRRFSEIIEDLELKNLPLQEGSFTWKGGAMQYVLPKSVSDHFPILLDGEGAWWKGLSFSESASYVLAAKLKALKSLLIDWNRMVFEENEVRGGVMNEFKLLLSAAGGWKPNISGMSFERLEDMETARLEKSFSKQEEKVMEFLGSFMTMAGRQILDVVLVANEVTYSILKSNEGAVMCKLDIEKAKWGFLLACKARGRGGEGVQVMMGLRINLDKSESILVGSVENAKALAANLGCKVGSLSSTHLCLPLSVPHRSVVVWDGKGQIEDRADSEGFLWETGPLNGNLILFSGVCWRFANERGVFWNQVIKGKYGEEQRGWCSKEVKGGYGVGLWKAFRKEWFVDAWVKDVWCSIEGGGNWSPHFSIQFNDWEMDEVCRFFLGLHGKRVQQVVEDRVLWRETKCGKFSVKSLYKSLVLGSPVSFPSSAIWKVYVQPRMSFFGWEAMWERPLTLDQLQKRGWPLANKCYLCQRHEESIDHILLLCVKARILWALLFSLFGVQWVLPATVKATLLGWDGSFVGKKRKGVWRASPLSFFLDGLEGKEQSCF
ncbi:hypothetical protein CK203_092382 [Vitis vinifera]|uniref:Reverse transcriptase zinc-binding domain-containing protein n=1 Tax=Vitis vinifera TaxID=29760 RepID=A0A438F0S3_VITVI|nr:hypothetical protein CK203_092382 [Vitis vinifera]